MSDERDPRRRFNTSERVALFLAADGRCANADCGRPLEPGWHGDHVTPHSRGGPTDVINGQALCPRCDLLKGDRMPVPSGPLPLRQWQQEALLSVQEHTGRDFLIVATPGAGKTRVSLEIARKRLERGRDRQIIVVCPTLHLKQQWADAAALAGIDLNPDLPNGSGPLADDYHGIVATYQQVGQAPKLFRWHASNKPTTAILDELHHAGDQRNWGMALAEAFEPAAFRLGLSGTPFRSDKQPIAFLDYGSDGYAKANYEYGYGAALGADPPVVRPVLFPRYGGRTEWTSKGTVVSATFDEDLDGQGMSYRLRTALEAHTSFVDTMFSSAHEQLTQIRTSPDGDPRAGGLILAMNLAHAQMLREQLLHVTGIAAIVATSDDPEASEKIRQFNAGSQPWLIAVRMVSEGVDIPRLRVLVYLTNACTPTFFRQAVGRVVRWSGDTEDQTAFAYIPDDPRLRRLAQEIKNERDQALDQAEREAVERQRDEPTAGGSLFAPVSAIGEHAGDTFDGEHSSTEMLQQVERLKREMGIKSLITNVELLKFARAFGNLPAEPAAVAPTGGSAPAPKYQRAQRLRSLNSTMVRRIVAETGLEYTEVQIALNDYISVRSVKQASEDQLAKRLEYAQQWLSAIKAGEPR